MITRLQHLLQREENLDPKRSWLLSIIHIIVLASILLVVLIINTITPMPFTVAVLSILFVLVAASLVLTYFGSLLLGRILVPLALIVSITILTYNGSGMHDTAMLGYSAALILGGILVGRQWLWVFALACMGAITFVGISEINGTIVSPLSSQTGWDDILINYTLLMAIAWTLNLVTRRLEESLLEARKSEQAWKQSDERFRAFMETSPAIVIMKDEQSRYVYCNPRVESLFGLPTQEIVGKTEFDLFPREEAERFTASDMQVLRSGKPAVSEYKARLPSGEIRDWWVFKFPMHDPSGNQYVGLQILDITERKDAEDALARERDLLEALMASVPDTVYFKDMDSRFTRINQHQVEMLGVNSPKDAIGKSDADFMSEPLVEAFLQEEQLLLKTGNAILDRIEYNPFPDGRPRWLSASKAALRDREGNIIGLVGISRDITERKLAEIERERLIRDLETRNAELERFTYTVSHDLKSPIVTIQGFLGLLEKDALQGDIERINHDILRIKSATGKMHKLLGELLELSRIGRLMNPPEEIPFASIVQEAIANVGGQLQNRGVSVSLQPDLPTVYGDKVRLIEVVQNLLDNACKYMGEQPDPKIELGYQQKDGTCTFFVRDNGMGIDPKYHQRVFGLFDKLDPQSEGTGVGLAVVKRIVEVHGGRIWIESDGPGHGSTFHFTLAEKPAAPHHTGRDS